ncbi:MAG TPA: PhoD-like phosphatase N-terminal domain-containing protein, partial [Phototrophicaceae bacterium]|nr:PhoD-like phosphatase N-terminal domain-containing protein [Phototrophicaceae bacterium]
MKLSRRDFIRISAVGLSGVGLSPKWTWLARQTQAPPTPAATSTLPNGTAAGDVTETTAILWAHSTALGTVQFSYTAARATFDPYAATVFTAEVVDPMLPVKVVARNLLPGTEYVYQVTDAAGSTASGRFATLPADGAKVGLHFGVTGDWRGELRPYVALSNVAAMKLDFFMEHGDTIYADVPSIDFPGDHAVSLADFRVKHNEVYSSRYGHNIWADIRASTSVYAINDDHEV